MCTIRCPVSVQPVSTHPAVAVTGRRRAALLVALNLAAAGIYFTHLGHGIGLGGYRIDLDAGQRAGRTPRLPPPRHRVSQLKPTRRQS